MWKKAGGDRTESCSDAGGGRIRRLIFNVVLWDGSALALMNRLEEWGRNEVLDTKLKLILKIFGQMMRGEKYHILQLVIQTTQTIG